MHNFYDLDYNIITFIVSISLL